VTDFKVVPEYLIAKGNIRTPKSRSLLRGHKIFIVGKKTVGSLYTLAKNHNMQAHTERGIDEGREGTYVWFTPIAQDKE
jgi:hypothetical protein